MRCAIEVQNGMIERNAGLPSERRIEFRVGIHLGDVVDESDGDLMGDGHRISDHPPARGCVPYEAGKTLVNPLVLVVDDEPDVEVLFRQQFRRDLRTGRFTMEFAQSAPAALQRITDAAGVSLILILSDINMPGMSGLELLPKAKALRPDVPIIMITAYGDAETERQALENGAEALLTKPIDFGTLRSEIDMRVERAA